jgi:hypothetical protein
METAQPKRQKEQGIMITEVEHGLIGMQNLFNSQLAAPEPQQIEVCVQIPESLTVPMQEYLDKHKTESWDSVAAAALAQYLGVAP